MAALVWGTRIKEEHIGSAAFDCPACGERVVGDAFKVLKATHAYFIRGRFREIQRYARCRLCAVLSDLPETARPEVLKQLNIIFPTNDFISRTNPALIDKPKPENSNYPKSLEKTRHELSLFHGILNEINNQKSSSKAAGNAEGIILLVLMASLFLSMVLYDKFSNHIGLFLITLWAITLSLIIYFFRLQSTLMFKAAHQYLNIHIQRFMEFKHVQLQDLISQVSNMKGEFKIVKRYLLWAEKRIDPSSYYTNIGY